MPAISLPLAQSKVLRRSVGLRMMSRVPWTPSYFCDQTHIRRPSVVQLQGYLYGRESSAPAGMTALLVTPISCSTPQPYVKNDTLDHRFDFGNRATAFSLDREGGAPLWL